MKKGWIQAWGIRFQGVGEAVVRVAWGQGPVIGPDFTLVMLRGRVFSSYIFLKLLHPFTYIIDKSQV